MWLICGRLFLWGRECFRGISSLWQPRRPFPYAAQKVPVIGSVEETCPLPPAASVFSCCRNSWHPRRRGTASPHTHSQPATPPAAVGDRQETNGRSDCFLGCSLSASAAEESKRGAQVFSRHAHTHNYLSVHTGNAHAVYSRIHTQPIHAHTNIRSFAHMDTWTHSCLSPMLHSCMHTCTSSRAFSHT